MNGLRSMALVMLALAGAACGTSAGKGEVLAGGAYTQVEKGPAAQAENGADQATVRDAGGAVVVQKVPFAVGVSTRTVERLALGKGCASTRGAGLLTDKGPVEIYRVQCEDGSTFMAQCELRQCRSMR